MAAIAVTTADRIHVVQSIEQFALIAEEAIEAGAATRLNTTTGKATNSNASGAAEARVLGICLESVAAGEACTVLRKGILDGYTISQAFDAPVYLNDTDGVIGDAAGTVSVVIGRVVPGLAELRGDTAAKLLLVDL